MCAASPASQSSPASSAFVNADPDTGVLLDDLVEELVAFLEVAAQPFHPRELC
jgi:hypothetical protein